MARDPAQPVRSKPGDWLDPLLVRGGQGGLGGLSFGPRPTASRAGT
jgi:hypothetical protein